MTRASVDDMAVAARVRDDLYREATLPTRWVVDLPTYEALERVVIDNNEARGLGPCVLVGPNDGMYFKGIEVFLA